HLPAHVLHHLVHSVYFDLAFLITLERKADRHVLGGLHQQGSVVLLICGCLCGQTSQQLLKIQSRVGIGFADFFLQRILVYVGITLPLSEASEQADGLNHFLFLQRDGSTCPCGGCTSGCSCSCCCARDRIRGAAQRNHRRAAGRCGSAAR